MHGTLSNTIDVFTSVEKGEALYGVVPLENSTYGPVVATLDLLADRDKELRNVSVFGEIFLDINHYLVGFRSGSGDSHHVPGDTTPTPGTPKPRKPKSHPLRDISYIKLVYSHNQAFGQCGPFISTYLKGADLQESSSTSKGAQLVAASGDSSTAAIASKTAAEVFGLTILAERIQQSDDNKTRFLVLVNTNHTSLPNKSNPPIPQFFQSDPPTTAGKKKGLVSFIIDHRRAGALADALNVFRTYNLNLTSINSRPNQTEAWQYIFFVEFEGVAEDSEHTIVNLQDALRQLQSCTTYCRWYGCWKMMETRALS